MADLYPNMSIDRNPQLLVGPLIPPELILHILQFLPLLDLISAYHVNRKWRSLVPEIRASPRHKLFSLAFSADNMIDASRVSLADRRSYVDEIENRYDVTIPEPYRIVLTEWPRSHPPPGFHWPHAVRFHAHGFCSCDQSYDPSSVCSCKADEVTIREIRLSEVILQKVTNREPFDFCGTDHAQRELFCEPPRLHTPFQNEQTLRLIRAHPVESYGWVKMSSVWRTMRFKVLRMSQYRYFDNEDEQLLADGYFGMMLEGPTRGQIHGWSSGVWYDGFEAEDFFEWNYTSRLWRCGA